MAKQTINIGSIANDGTGDPIRTAFDKTNQNFTELYNTLGASVITTNGTNVGIGTSTPDSKLVVEANTANAAVRITQTGAGNALLVEDSTNPDATPFVIDASGFVVVGHTSYDSNWFSSGNTPRFWTVGNATTNRGYGAINYAGASTLSLFRASGGTVGTEGAVSSGDTVGVVTFGGYDGVASGALGTATIFSVVDGAYSSGSIPGRLVFATTANGAATPSERMRITNSGKVGIGSTTLTNYSLRMGVPITGGTTAYGTATTSAVQSDVTNSAYVFWSYPTTQATTFTLTNLNHFRASQQTFGANSTVTNQYGFTVDTSLTGAANNYGFYSAIPAAAGRWNFYAQGSANNYFAGDTIIASNTLNVGTSSNNGANGSVWLPNGMKMCWGVLVVNSTSVATYSNAFPTATVSVTVTPTSTIHLNANTIYVSSVNTTAAVIRSASTTTTGNAYYMAIGY